MKAFVLGFALVFGFLSASAAHAGFFEISANGSFFKYNNGLVGGEPSSTIIRRLGGGLGYRFLQNTSIELNYTHSRNQDQFTQDSAQISSIWRIEKLSEFQNLSLSLVIEFTGKNSPFRPYIRGGGGYMIRKTTLAGKATNRITEVVTDLEFNQEPETQTASADGGIGFKLFVADSIALEFSGNVYATDLDKSEIYLHYSYTGGLRFVF